MKVTASKGFVARVIKPSTLNASRSLFTKATGAGRVISRLAKQNRLGQPANSLDFLVSRRILELCTPDGRVVMRVERPL